MLPCPRAFPGRERRQYPYDGKEGAAEVRNLNAGKHRTSVFIGLESEDSREREVIHVVSSPLAHRPALAVPADGTVNEARLNRSQRFVIKSQTLHHPGTESFENDIGIAHKAAKNLRPFRRLEVH